MNRDKNRVIIFDTTLRDGAQTQGVIISVDNTFEILVNFS